MNGFLLLVPFLAIRLVLLPALSKNSSFRAAHFAPMAGTEKIAYYVYQASTVWILAYPFFLRVRADFSWWFYLGAPLYLLGLLLCGITVVDFSSPDTQGLNTNGIYRFSRNPMYAAYFLCFLGAALLTQSLILLGVVLIFQISAHWIILAEERWCIAQFGENYRQYMRRVRRYF